MTRILIYTLFVVYHDLSNNIIPYRTTLYSCYYYTALATFRITFNAMINGRAYYTNVFARESVIDIDLQSAHEQIADTTIMIKNCLLFERHRPRAQAIILTYAYRLINIIYTLQSRRSPLTRRAKR